MYYGSYQFPNLMLNLHPDCAMVYIGYPKGPNHTTVVSEFMFRPETIADPELFKPEPDGRVLGHDQQAGLGDLRTRADRRQFARLHAWASTRARTGSCTGSTRNGAARWAAPPWADDRTIP